MDKPQDPEHTDPDFIDLLSTHLLVPWYLIAAFLYYEANESLLTDQQFDELAGRLDAEWAVASRHPNANLIDRAALKSGGHYLVGKFPLRVKVAAARLLGRRVYSR